ncbi:hypothetical protein ACS0TY_022814 [Phlomoides rotata]
MDWAVATEILEKETASTASATPICSNLRLDSIFKEGLREGSAISELQKRLEISGLQSNPELIIDEIEDKVLGLHYGQMATPANAFVLAPFTGKGDFSIWKQKMKCILIQQRVFKAVDESYSANETEDKKTEMNEFALSSIVLNLSDSVLRKVGQLDFAKDLWNKLEELYNDSSLPSKLFLLEKFFQFKLDLNKDIDENLDIFTKLIQDIKQTGDKHIDEYTAVVLLNAIPDTYNDVKSAIKYGRDNVTLDIVVNCLKSKEHDLKHNGKGSKNSGEVMHVRGRSSSRSHNKKKHDNQVSDDNKKPYGNNRSKSRNRKCFNCGESGHYYKACTNPKKKQQQQNGHYYHCVYNACSCCSL